MTAKVYYVVMQRGLPHSVYSYEHKALEVAKEVSVKGAPAEVVAVSPLQQELPFDCGCLPKDDTCPLYCGGGSRDNV